MNEFLDTLIVFRSIGAFVRWSFSGFKSSFMQRIENSKPLPDLVLGLAIVVLLIVGIVKLAT